MTPLSPDTTPPTHTTQSRGHTCAHMRVLGMDILGECELHQSVYLCAQALVLRLSKCMGERPMRRRIHVCARALVLRLSNPPPPQFRK
jgi:hypothetical protein